MLRGNPCSGFEREGSLKKHCWVLPPDFKGQSMKWKTFINTLVRLVKERVIAYTRHFQKQKCSPGGLGKKEAPWHNSHQPRLLCLLVIHYWQLLGRNPVRACSDALQHPSARTPAHTQSLGFLMIPCPTRELWGWNCTRAGHWRRD